MTAVEVIVPYMAGDLERAENLCWLLDRLCMMPKVTVAELPEGPWIKAAAVRPAIEASTADIVIIHDADIGVPGLTAAVVAVMEGAAWAVPHLNVHRLTQAATGAVLDGATPRAGMSTTERPYEGVPGGGCVVLPRKLALDVPLDPRFVGWGGEDLAWGYALTTLAGEPWRSDEPLYHLWHPTPERTSRKLGSHQNEQVRRLYREARLFVTDMEALVRTIPDV